MKNRLFLCVLLCAFASPSGLQAEDAKPKPAAKEESELEHVMDRMEDAYRKVKRQVADASKNADTLGQVAIMREAAEASLKLEPAMKADKPVEEQAKFVAAYQAKMKKMLAEIVKLENALKAGNNDEAVKIFTPFRDMEKQGHKEFKRPKEKKS